LFLCLDCPGLPFCLSNIQHEHPWPSQDLNPQSQQAIGRWDSPNRPSRRNCRMRHRGRRTLFFVICVNDCCKLDCLLVSDFAVGPTRSVVHVRFPCIVAATAIRRTQTYGNRCV
jgi:hypothetical protein